MEGRVSGGVRCGACFWAHPRRQHGVCTSRAEAISSIPAQMCLKSSSLCIACMMWQSYLPEQAHSLHLKR